MDIFSAQKNMSEEGVGLNNFAKWNVGRTCIFNDPLEQDLLARFIAFGAADWIINK